MRAAPLVQCFAAPVPGVVPSTAHGQMKAHYAQRGFLIMSRALPEPRSVQVLGHRASMSHCTGLVSDCDTLRGEASLPRTQHTFVGRRHAPRAGPSPAPDPQSPGQRARVHS